MDNEDAVNRLKKIVERFEVENPNAEHLTVKVHHSLTGGWDIEEEWDWRG